MPKECEYCKTTKGTIRGKSGKFQMDLCVRHYGQMVKHGKILNRTKYDSNKFEANDDIVEITMYNKYGAELGKTLIDLEFLDIVKEYKWHITARGYVRGRNKGRRILLHRLITNAAQDMVVDHISHDKLDNRLNNLRICTHRENMMNTPRRTNNTSGYKGVVWFKRDSLWVAQIRAEGRMINLGRYKDINDAIDAYKSASIKYFGEFACFQ